MNMTTMKYRILVLGASTLILSPLAADEIDSHSESGKLYQAPAEYRSAENSSPDTKEHAKSNRRLEMYIPPAPTRPTPLIRVATGGTRSLNNGFPVVTLLVPEHVAFTVLVQPTLYWHISQATQKPVVLTLKDDDSVKPLLEEPLKGPVSRGIHTLKLADYGIHLRANKTYEWSVSVTEESSDTSSGDLVARSHIERVIANSEIRAMFEHSDPLSRAQAYARNGIWHDALTVLSEEAPSALAQNKLRRARDLLLEQVGLLHMRSASRASIASNIRVR